MSFQPTTSLDDSIVRINDMYIYLISVINEYETEMYFFSIYVGKKLSGFKIPDNIIVPDKNITFGNSIPPGFDDIWN